MVAGAAGTPPAVICAAGVGGLHIAAAHGEHGTAAVAAEQKARTTYDNILRLVKDPEVCDPIRFLRKREIVHYQRFGESLRIVQDNLNSKNFYAINPEFDTDSNSSCGN